MQFRKDYSSDNDDSVVATSKRMRQFQRNSAAKHRENACDQKIRLPVRWIVVMLLLVFGIILVNEILFPHLNLVPIRTGIDFATIVAIPVDASIVSFTAVGFKGSKEMLDNHKVLAAIQAYYNRKNLKKNEELQIKSVQIPTEAEFFSWLQQRQDAHQVPYYHLTSPVNFVTIGGQRAYIGGIEDLIKFVERDRSHFEGIELSEFKQQYPSTDEILDKAQEDDFYDKVFQANYKDVEPTFSSKDLLHKGIGKKVKSMLPKLEQQVDLSKRQNIVVTAFRKNPEKQVTNYRPLWKYLVSEGWKFKWRAPNLASIIIVQDQSSASQALRYKNSIVNNIGMGGQSCYGGTKGTQLRCRLELTERHGCDYDELRIQPTQYRFWIEEECTRFFDTVCDTVAEDGTRTVNEPRLWIEKPNAGQHGIGMKVHRGCEDMKKRWGKCNKSNFGKKKAFVMEYIDPALLDGHKFDLRTFLLVASLDPLIVFYHDGFVRRAGTPYDSDLKDTKAHITNAHSQDGVEDHFWDFSRLESYLHQELGFPADYMSKNFKEHAMKVENFVFQAARSNMFRRKGTFQLFALDWIIDSKGGIHMLEANSNPLVTNYPIPGYPETWHSMMDLILKIHVNPDSITEPLVTIPSSKRFKHDSWELVFNENEELSLGLEYNSCQALAGLNQAPFAANSFDEEELLKNIQAQLNIEDEHLEQLAKEEAEDAEKQTVESQTEKQSRDESFMELSPKEILKKIIAKNIPRQKAFDPELFSCVQTECLLDSCTSYECILGKGSKVETSFNVFQPREGISDETPTIMVVSGVHGNEPSGVIAANVLRKQINVLEARLIVVERVNKQGVLRSQRYLNENKLDPNRIFPDSLTEEPKGTLGKELWKVVEYFKPDLFFDLHEGWGIYAALKDNPNPSGKLIGNKKFSKGSSIISSFNAVSTVKTVTEAINNAAASNELLKTLREELTQTGKDPNTVFMGISPPISGGLAQRVTRFFGSMSFVQETTSRQGSQKLETRALQHIMLFSLTLKELGIAVASKPIYEECKGEVSCVIDSKFDWISKLAVPTCVAGRINCRLPYPDNASLNINPPTSKTEQVTEADEETQSSAEDTDVSVGVETDIGDVLSELQGVLDELETTQ